MPYMVSRQCVMRWHAAWRPSRLPSHRKLTVKSQPEHWSRPAEATHGSVPSSTVASCTPWPGPASGRCAIRAPLGGGWSPGPRPHAARSRSFSSDCHHGSLGAVDRARRAAARGTPWIATRGPTRAPKDAFLKAMRVKEKSV